MAWHRGLTEGRFRRPHKYGAKRIVDASGYSFASKLEREVFSMLKLREAAGEIRDITVQNSVYLTEARIQYIADFRVFDIQRGAPVWIEAKGFEKDTWRIKRRLWKAGYGPGPLQIYKSTGGRNPRVYMTEEIVPRENTEETQHGKETDDQ